MHTSNHIVRSKPKHGRIRRSDAFGARLILAVPATAGVGFSVLATDPGLATQPAAQVTAIEDWPGNVAASGR